jgi:hypothetical protein
LSSVRGVFSGAVEFFIVFSVGYPLLAEGWYRLGKFLFFSTLGFPGG